MSALYYIFIYFLRPLFYPFLYFVLPELNHKLKERKIFENKNKKDFNDTLFIASAAFEVSSEGELEQVRPIIDALIERGKGIELIFCSPSVEKNCELLFKKFPQQVRLYRYPLISFLPWGKNHLLTWVTAKKIFLCRYDFFPEIMILGRKKDRSFYLISASIKQKADQLFQRKNSYYYYWKFIYRSFDLIVAATQGEKEKLLQLFHLDSSRILAYDFRINQIYKRWFNREKSLQSHEFFFKFFSSYLNHFPIENRIIFGSFWPKESHIFNNDEWIQKIKEKKSQITILPHLLDQNSMNELLRELNSSFAKTLPIYMISTHQQIAALEELFEQIEQEPGIIILAVKGILCELYSQFGHAFVGGGHGRSVHSVLEPYLNLTHVYMGPKVFRSTEYDFICEQSPNYVHVIDHLPNFYDVYQQNISLKIDREKRISLMENSGEMMETFLHLTSE